MEEREERKIEKLKKKIGRLVYWLDDEECTNVKFWDAYHFWFRATYISEATTSNIAVAVAELLAGYSILFKGSPIFKVTEEAL